jgi:hypothetical protein
MGRFGLGSLVTAPGPDHHRPVAGRAGRGHDGSGEAAPSGAQDEVDRVDRVARDAAVEDDGRDVVPVEVERPVERLQAGDGQARDAVLGQGVHPAVDDLGEVVGEQDERRRGGDLAEGVAGHDDSSEVVRAGMTPHASSKHLTGCTQYGVVEWSAGTYSFRRPEPVSGLPVHISPPW